MILFRLVMIAALVAGLALIAEARDTGQWGGADPAVRAWFESLKQPDNGGSCCGPADAYEVSETFVRDGRVFVTILDNKGNPLPIGREVEIPREKMNRDRNLVGHPIAFIASGGHVFCFIDSLKV